MIGAKIGRVILIVMLLAVSIESIGAQLVEDPDWLLRTEIEDAALAIEPFTPEGSYPVTARDPETGEQVQNVVSDLFNFSLSSPAYVYLFHIGPVSDPFSVGEGPRDVHLIVPLESLESNYFDLGVQNLPIPFEIQGPAGEAYIQAFATPLPINIAESTTDEFRYLGNDPTAIFAGIRSQLEALGLREADWAANWTYYRIESGTTAAGAGSRCTNARLSVPGAEGQTVKYTIDKNCITGVPISNQFVGPTSKKIPQVLEGSRTITVEVEGFSPEQKTVNVPFGQTTNIQFALGNQNDFIGISVDPINPRIYEDITFSSNVASSRPISRMEWDFGDGTAIEPGFSVTHAYREPSPSGIPYRAILTVYYSDNQSPGSELFFADINVNGLPPSCPPDNFTEQPIVNGIEVTSMTDTGCASIDVPADLVEFDSARLAGGYKLNLNYHWLNVPDDSSIAAQLFVLFYNENETSPSGQQVFALLPATEGTYNKETNLTMPEFSRIEAKLVLNLIDNPKMERLVFQLNTLRFRENANCSSAQLYTRNDVTDAQDSSGRSAIAFREIHEVEIHLSNDNCNEITIHENGLRIVRNSDGAEVARLSLPEQVVDENDEMSWAWDQRDNDGDVVGRGLYWVIADTSAGEYRTQITLIN